MGWGVAWAIFILNWTAIFVLTYRVSKLEDEVGALKGEKCASCGMRVPPLDPPVVEFTCPDCKKHRREK